MLYSQGKTCVTARMTIAARTIYFLYVAIRKISITTRLKLQGSSLASNSAEMHGVAKEKQSIEVLRGLLKLKKAKGN